MLGHQMTRHKRAESTGGTGEQNSAVRIEHGRQPQHILANVPPLAHPSKGLLRTSHIPSPDGRQTERSALEQAHELSQYLLKPIASGIHQVKRTVGHIWIL